MFLFEEFCGGCIASSVIASAHDYGWSSHVVRAAHTPPFRSTPFCEACGVISASLLSLWWNKALSAARSTIYPTLVVAVPGFSLFLSPHMYTSHMWGEGTILEFSRRCRTQCGPYIFIEYESSLACNAFTLHFPYGCTSLQVFPTTSIRIRSDNTRAAFSFDAVPMPKKSII